MELFKLPVSEERYKLYKRLYAAVYAAKKSNEFLHQMTSEWFGKNSLRDLTDDEMKETIRKINLIRESSVPCRCSPKQYNFIMRLKATLEMSCDQFSGFMRKTCRGKDNINILNKSDAAALITGLLKFKKSLQSKVS